MPKKAHSNISEKHNAIKHFFKKTAIANANYKTHNPHCWIFGETTTTIS